jgi:PAS domain S-box-containing protein
MTRVGRDPSGDGDGNGPAGRDRVESGGIETDAVAELGVDFAFRLTPDGVIDAVSGAVERLLGDPERVVVGHEFDRYVSDGDTETAAEGFRAAMAGETVRGVAVRLARDGTDPTWVEVSAEPIRRNGEVVAVRGAAREATERRRAIERHSAAMKGAIDGMALLGDDGRYLFVNDAHADLYGYEPDDLVGASWTRLYDECERRRLESEALPTMRRSGHWRGTAVGRRQDGSTFQQELSLSTLEEGFVCVVRDVTERHQREQIIEVLDRVLRHNLRNDMNVVMGEAEMLSQTTDDRTAAAADRIADRARSLLDVSDTARAVREVVASEGDQERADLCAVVERCCRQVDTAEMAVSVPETPVVVACTGLRHAVTELVENAVEHGSAQSATRGASTEVPQLPGSRAAFAAPGPAPDSDGEASVQVEVTLDERDGARMAVLRVVDDGPGVPEMERSALEEGQETPLRHGQGLGLWLVNWVVTRAGGSLSVTECDDEGAAVEVRLPTVA